MQRLEVSCAVRHIYVVRRQRVNSFQSIIRRLSVRFVTITGGTYRQFICVLELLTRCIYNIGRLSLTCLHVLTCYTVHNQQHVLRQLQFLLVSLCTFVVGSVQYLSVLMFAVLQCRAVIIYIHILYRIYVVFCTIMQTSLVGFVKHFLLRIPRRAVGVLTCGQLEFS